jgi:hypothetical protein
MSPEWPAGKGRADLLEDWNASQTQTFERGRAEPESCHSVRPMANGDYWVEAAA